MTPCYVVKTLTNYQYNHKDETFLNYLRKVQIFSVHRAHEGLGFCYVAEFSMKVSYVKHSWEKENFRYKKVFVLGILIVVWNKDLEDASMCIFELINFLKLLANHHHRLYFIRKKENYWQFSLLPVSMILLRWYTTYYVLMQPKLGVTVLTLSARRLYKWKMDRRCFSLSNYNFERFELELGKKVESCRVQQQQPQHKLLMALKFFPLLSSSICPVQLSNVLSFWVLTHVLLRSRQKPLWKDF